MLLQPCNVSHILRDQLRYGARLRLATGTPAENFIIRHRCDQWLGDRAHSVQQKSEHLIGLRSLFRSVKLSFNPEKVLEQELIERLAFDALDCVLAQGDHWDSHARVKLLVARFQIAAIEDVDHNELCEDLRHVADDEQRPRVTIKIVPVDRQAHRAQPSGSWCILSIILVFLETNAHLLQLILKMY